MDDAYKVLGVPKGTILQRKEDLDKVRQRSKELYKRYVKEKRSSDAKRVIAAFEQIKKNVEESKSGHKKENGATSSRSKPDAKPDEAVRRTSSGGSSGDLKRSSSGLSRTSSSGDPKKSRPSAPLIRIGSDIRSRPNPRDGTAMTGGATPIPGCARSVGSSTPIPGCAKPASSSAPQNIGPAKNATVMLDCSCGQSFIAEKFPPSVRHKQQGFKCPSCRIRKMDPFNPLLRGRQGMLKLLLGQAMLQPGNGESSKEETKFKFQVDLTGLQKWRKQGHNVEVRMCCLDTYSADACWPRFLLLEVNGRKVFQIDPPNPGHKRRDVPKRVSAEMKGAVNLVKVSFNDPDVSRWALAIVRTAPQQPWQLCKHVKCVKEEDCQQRVADLLFHSTLEGSGAECQAVGADRSSLICPVTLSRIKTPVRGYKCRHLQCFDLEAYLVANLRMKAFNNRWYCPVCNLPLRPPGDLFIDTYLLRILANTEKNDVEIGYDLGGAWTVTATEEELPPDSDDDGQGAHARESTTLGQSQQSAQAAGDSSETQNGAVVEDDDDCVLDLGDRRLDTNATPVPDDDPDPLAPETPAPLGSPDVNGVEDDGIELLAADEGDQQDDAAATSDPYWDADDILAISDEALATPFALESPGVSPVPMQSPSASAPASVESTVDAAAPVSADTPAVPAPAASSASPVAQKDGEDGSPTAKRPCRVPKVCMTALSGIEVSDGSDSEVAFD